MSDTLEIPQEAIRAAIQANPEIVLDDIDLLSTLMAHSKDQATGNVINFQGVMIERLREKLSLAEADHKALLEVAIANMHALDQIHEACVAMLEADSATDFVDAVQTGLPPVLGVDYATLAVEATTRTTFANAAHVAPGALGSYFSLGGYTPASGSEGKVVLRPTFEGADILYADDASRYQSEALVILDTGPHSRPALLVFADTDPTRFDPEQSAELLLFMGRIAELIVQKWQTHI